MEGIYGIYNVGKFKVSIVLVSFLMLLYTYIISYYFSIKNI